MSSVCIADEIKTNTMQTHDLQPLCLKTPSANEDEISRLLSINCVNVLQVKHIQ